VKRIVRSISVETAEVAARAALDSSTAAEAAHALRSRLKRAIDDERLIGSEEAPAD
jgi:hypothetical protein